jgi:hypothetical protein
MGHVLRHMLCHKWYNHNQKPPAEKDGRATIVAGGEALHGCKVRGHSKTKIQAFRLRDEATQEVPQVSQPETSRRSVGTIQNIKITQEQNGFGRD